MSQIARFFRVFPTLVVSTCVLVPSAANAQCCASPQQQSREPPARIVRSAPVRAPGDAERAPSAAPTSTVRFAIPGEWQIRFWAQPALNLPTTPGILTPNTLGQTWYLEQWFRLRPAVHIGESLAIHAQFDVTRAIIVGDSTRQVELSRDNRSTLVTPFTYGIADLRELYVDWKTPIGIIRAGQQLSHWGLGIVANSGDTAQPFGDYRMGDIVERLAFATRPLGAQSSLVLAAAGDLVFRDRLANLLEYQIAVERGEPPFASTIIEQPATRTVGGDWAWQGVLSAFSQDPNCHTDCEKKRVGMYAAYRGQSNRLGDGLRVGLVDFAARWDWPSPDGAARVFVGIEQALVVGQTTMLRNLANPDGHLLLQHGGAFQLGVERAQVYRFVMEAGYASGDSTPSDATQSRFAFNPSHRVGLILFPEVLAWQTARSATLATDARLLGVAPRGTDLLPSSGGVTNAAYFYPTVQVTPNRWLELKAGAVIAMATSALVDPVRSTLFGRSQNFVGGDANARDLGIEFDLGAAAKIPLPGGIGLNVGVQGAVFLPGHAFANSSPSNPDLPTRWLGVVRVGMNY